MVMRHQIVAGLEVTCFLIFVANRPFHSITNTSKIHSAVQRGALFLCSLLAVTSQFSVLIRQKMQLTGWDNGN